MDPFVAVVAVAVWMLLMVPAALVAFIGGGADTGRHLAPPDLTVIPAPAATEDLAA